MTNHELHLRDAVTLALDNVAEGGRPYGAVIVHRGTVVSRAVNTIHRTGDPTDHAEMVALRETSRSLGRSKLSDCVVYASGRPCPMCHAAMRLAGIREAYFAFTAEDAEDHGLLSAGIYAELARPLDEQPMRVRHLSVDEGVNPYAAWNEKRADG